MIKFISYILRASCMNYMQDLQAEWQAIVLCLYQLAMENLSKSESFSSTEEGEVGTAIPIKITSVHVGHNYSFSIINKFSECDQKATLSTMLSCYAGESST